MMPLLAILSTSENVASSAALAAVRSLVSIAARMLLSAERNRLRSCRLWSRRFTF